MRISQFLAFVATCVHALGYSLFRASHETPITNDRVEPVPVTPDFNPTELLDSKSRKPEVYIKAMLELKRLEEQPVCHRLAAQLLMNNCRGLDGVDAENYDFNSVHLQRHHVESFAASLAICDLERAKFTIPRSCSPFRSLALHKAAHDGKGKLEVSAEEVGDCLESFGQDHSHWNTWISYRDKALLFCKAARLDIDKDQFILLHTKLIETMEIFTSDLEEDLNTMKQKLANNERIIDSYFEKMSNHVEDWTSEVQGSLGSVSVDVQTIKSSMKSVVDTTGDAVHMMKKFISTFLQGHAKMADEQEKALAVTTNKVQLQMVSLADMVGEAQQGTLELKTAIGTLVPAVIYLHSRQTAMKDQSTAIFSNLMNATEILQAHVQKLAQAESAVSGIHENLDRAAEAVKSWSENLPAGGGFTDWALRIGAPLTALVLGNYGITPTLTMNAVLLVSGLVGGEAAVQLRHWGLPYNWCWMWWPGRDPEKPNDKYMPQDQDKSLLATIPVDFETASTSTTDPSSIDTAHVDMA